jgi:S-DNA-T family DNA segregation ATPase FtsK/SpoIIIE
MLFLWPGTSTLIRGQGTYVTDDEINRVVDFVSTTPPDYVTELVQLKAAAPGEGDVDRFKSRDDLYEAAIDLVVREGRGSVSLLQRALGIGYGRGARLVDFMAEDGIVGAYNGSQAREVLITIEQWEEMCGQKGSAEPPPAVTPPKRTHNKIRPEQEEEEEEEAPFDVADEQEEGEYDDEDADASEYEDDEADEEDEDSEDEDYHAHSA